ncbi:FKBP-type peptidyl-prolyl cis-trans isomerase [Serratia fonticola]|uniref:FKBP-type peptidyl-prolyl cis-trans isomerase N-terminal domain-containing protein n=1 Tax=Serratia fonticola TaxID=47917 RepID=UPI0015C5A714|nr:FKBP-type peptidyl-prolyl cis-trans isomerase N-terminal domain-containing protein [Serratia fonticola]MBC3379713.1 FKBP-type peptidyl-prolyl cis-trans isomerase [Serratia fonticola]NYA38912.1 FKBP-type peptidyl-prolyl cis-trans isomerase [Serratia fonticola]
MKLGLKYGLALSLTLPVGCALGSEQLKADRASTIQALEAITSQESEAPALLLLSPSQLNEISPPAERKVSKPSTNTNTKTQTRESAPLQAQIKQLNAALAQRDQELRQLRQAAQQDADARAEISQLKKTLQENLQATEQMQQDMVAAATAKGDNSNENGRLQQALDQSRQQSSALQKQLAALAKAHTDNSEENKALQAELNDSRQQAEQAKKALAELSAKAEAKPILQLALDESLHNQLTMLKVANEQQQAENSQLQQQLATQPREVIEPKSELEIRDYAIGSSLAEDMLALLKQRAAQGVEVDSRLALAGVQDTFAGKLKLQPEQIDKALDASEKLVQRNAQQQKLDTEKAGASYIEQFAKQKQVKKEALGYFYRIDKTGKGALGANNMVSVAVKESLINGKVIKDMQAAGTSVTQLLSSYPPIFRTAISKLQNHGSITMVVPPSLAYGDKGLPPDILPGSTMVYNVTVLDVAPAK